MRKWQPYAANGTPGIWADLSNMLPTRSGTYLTGPLFSAISISAPATPGTTIYAEMMALPSDSAVGYVGTSTKLYFYDGTGFTHLSRGGGYTAADWSFVQFGNISIACDRVDATQFRDATGALAFADLAGAPKAAIAVTQQSQVLLFDLNDGAEKPDYFIACAPGDYTTWTGASATGPNPIWNRPGRIKAAVAFRDYVLVFKRSSVYRLTYTGSSLKWKVELIAIGKGAWGKHDVVNCGDVVVFSGPGGAWRFDGANFTSISDLGPFPTTAACAGSYYSTYTGNAYFAFASGVIYGYNVISDCWGLVRPTLTSGGVVGGFVMLCGDGIPLLLGPSTSITEFSLQLLNLSNATPRYDSGEWSAGQSSDVAYLAGSVEGAGGRAITDFTGMDVMFTTSRPGDPRPNETLTGLTLDIRLGDALDDSSLDDDDPAVIVQSVNCSTTQRRFDFMQAAVYARFRINIPANKQMHEVADYTLHTQPGGYL